MKQATDTEKNNSLGQIRLYTADRMVKQIQLTCKLRLDYSNRNKLRIAAQIKNDISSKKTSDSDLIQDKCQAT